MNNDLYTRHDRRKDRTRSHLQEAIIDLVLERGYEEIVIQDITDRADVGRGTFYFHFESKEDLLWSIVEDRFPLQEKNTASLFDAGMDQPEYYQYVNRFRHYEKNKAVFLAIMGSNGSMSIASRVNQSLVAETIREMEAYDLFGEVGQPVEVTAQIVVSLTASLAIWWLENSFPYTSMQMAGILYQTLHHREPPGGIWQGGVPE